MNAFRIMMFPQACRLARPRLCLLLGAALFVGCSGRPEDVADVEGIVLLDNAPLAGATVHFQSVNDPGVIYVARTDKQGAFHLMHGRDMSGALIGEYKVRVSTAEPGNPDADPPLPPQPERVPEKYSGEGSELRETVRAGENQLRIELASE